MAYSKIHPVSLGVAVGIVSGFSAFFLALVANILFAGKPLVGMMGEMYITYHPSFFNCVLGGFAVSINAFIAGYIFAWVYNLMLNTAK